MCQNTFIFLDLSIGSGPDRLVLKNDAECTTQRLKQTSGARDMIIFRRLVCILLAQAASPPWIPRSQFLIT